MPKSAPLWWTNPPSVLRYGVTVVAVALAVIFGIFFEQTWHATPYVSLLLCAVIYSAWFGGFRAGFLAITLSALAFAYFFLSPRYSLAVNSNEVPRIVLYVLSAVAVALLGAVQRSSSQLLREARDKLAAKVAELHRINDALNHENVERQRVENALRQSETQLQEAQQVAHIGHWERDPVTDQIICSDEAFRILGLDPRPQPLSLAEVQQFIHPDDRARQKQVQTEAQQGCRPYDVEYRIVRPNGDVRFVHTLGHVTRDEAGRPILVFGTTQDITDRKRTESLLDGQKRVLEMIATDAPLTESLTALIHLIEGHFSGMLGSILLMDADGAHLRHGAAPSLPLEYVAEIDGGAIGPEAGSCGTAAYEKQAVVVEDIASDPRWRDYRAVALAHGLRACWSTPIFSAQRHLLGTFAMYYRQPKLPEPEHLQLIETTAHIAAIAISRHHDQARLHDSEAKLKEAQRLANVGYWERDVTTDRVTWSEETWRIFGLPPGNRTTLSQAELREMIHPDDRQLQIKKLADALRDGRPYDVEYRIIRPNGEVRFVHIWDEIVCDEASRPRRMFGTVQDVTERKRAENLLHAREQEIRAIVENSPDLIVRFDRMLRRTYVNPAVVKASGVSRESLLGREICSTTNDAAAPATAEEIQLLKKSLKYVFDTGRPLHFESTWPLPVGRRAFFHHMVPEFDSQGMLTSVLSISRDITKLKESQQLLHLVLATLPVAVAVTDRTGDIVLANNTSKRLWGDVVVSGLERWTESKGFWHDTGKRIAPEDWASARALSGGQTSLNELIDIETFDGQRKTILNSSAPIRDAAGLIVGAVIVNEDVTELKASEEKLRRTEAELARVARITMMGELTTSIAHEVNQPLAAVVSNANAASRWLAASPPDLGEAREAVLRIARDGTRASEVIKRIRALAKKGEPTRVPVDLNELIKETVGLTHPDLVQKRVSLDITFELKLPAVPADRVQLQQVLLNLIVNALDSMSTVTEHPRVLRIQTGHVEPDTVQVTVKDAGRGISPAENEHLFQPFYTTKPHGLGMGLAISRSIVEAHGGRLWATPNDGPGATFHFTLPVQEGLAS